MACVLARMPHDAHAMHHFRKNQVVTKTASLGSRAWGLSGLSLLILLATHCGEATAPCLSEDGCESGAAGMAGAGATGGQSGAAANGGGGEAGQGGATTAGGQGGSAGQGGAGGAMGGSGGAGGGNAGAGGACVPSFECGPKNCGVADDGCGTFLNCNDPGPGDPVTCATQMAGESEGGPMTCNATARVCECVPEGNTPAAMSFCGGIAAEPAVADWCAKRGGCTTGLCGIPPVPKVPDYCIYSGHVLKPGPGVPDVHVWCCASVCSSEADCDDGNECTVGACGQDGHCGYPQPGPQGPCNNGAGVCVSGECVPL